MDEQSKTRAAAEPIVTQDNFNRARKCLVDNGIRFDEAEIVLQALCCILVGEEIKHLMFNAKTEAAKLKSDGISLEQVGKEINYRKNAGISSPDHGSICCGWDDELCAYTTAELEAMESAWDNAQ